MIFAANEGVEPQMNAGARRCSAGIAAAVVLCLALPTRAADGDDEPGISLQKLDAYRLGLYMKTWFARRDELHPRLGDRELKTYGPYLVQHTRPHARPYLFPIPPAAGAERPSTWRDGLSIGLRGVNGFSFWEDGTVQPRAVQHFYARSNVASWAVQSVWSAPDRQVQLFEAQRWTFWNRGDQVLDLDWELVAARDVEFSKQSVGGLVVRTPWGWDRHDAYVENDARQRGREADGREARWVLMTGPFQSTARKQTIVMMDHPDNPARPVQWRVDAEDGICASRQRADAWRLAKGRTVTERHRVVIMSGPPDRKRIEAIYDEFAGRARP
jgi:hypothetical protein